MIRLLTSFTNDHYVQASNDKLEGDAVSVSSDKNQPIVSRSEVTHTVVTGLNEPRSSYGGSFDDRSLTERQPTRSYIQPESIGSNTQGEEVSKHSLQFPDYSDQAIRLQSFKHWGGVLPAQELAEGGFYMIARRDVVRCFSCNVVVQDWERRDNVIDEHHRRNPNCSFLHRFVSSKGVSSAEKLRIECSSNTKLRVSFKQTIFVSHDQRKVSEGKQTCPTGRTPDQSEDFRIDESCGSPAPDPQNDDGVYTCDDIFISASDTGSIESEQFMVSCTG